MGPMELKMMLKAQALLLIFLVAFGGDVGVSGQIVAEKIPLGELKKTFFVIISLEWFSFNKFTTVVSVNAAIHSVSL